MEEQKPGLFIKELHFSDGTNLELEQSDIIVITGPNNSGKSRALKDINAYYHNNSTPRIVIKDIQLDFVGIPDRAFVNQYYISIVR